MTDDPRPDPDALLAQIRQDEQREVRGKLRIYFGSSAGVGKTYAMLAAARKLAAEGVDVLAGVVEKFYYLKLGLSVVLAFVGVKMLLTDVAKIPIALSLAVIATVIAVAIVASLLRNRRDSDSPGGTGGR